MCILFLHFCENLSPKGYRLIVAFNRDEFYSRPTAPAKFLDGGPSIIAGTDQKPGSEGGTWLGMSKDGRFGALTNYRTAPELIDPHARSRGHLVMDFLKENSSVQSYLDGVSQIGSKYNGFNLLIGQLSANQNCQFGWYTNMEGQPITVLGPGTHVLSNRLLNYPWPKVVYGRQRFEEIIGKTNTKKQLIADLILMLNEKQRHFPGEDDSNYVGPHDPGVDDPVWKDRLDGQRAIFVELGPEYGTRTNTIILVSTDGQVCFTERTMKEPINGMNPEWITNTYEYSLDYTSNL